MKDNQITIHHIIPRSRLQGKKHLDNNIVKVSHIEHDRYHQLFENKTPEEILLYLVTTFWGGNLDYIYDFLRKYNQLTSSSVALLKSYQFNKTYENT